MPNLLKANLQTPAGDLTLVIDGDILVICEFADRAHRVTKQLERFYKDHTVIEAEVPSHIQQVFDAYFAGDRDIITTIPTAPIGTPYEQTVWKNLQNIPAGNTASYGELAKQLGSSPRAVGRANGRNPVCLIHPCHRVIGADGSLTGYAGGLDRKEWLLKHEGAILNL